MLRLTYVKDDVETAPGSLRAAQVVASLPSSFSRRVKLELTKAEKTGCSRRIPAGLRATFWCYWQHCFSFYCFRNQEQPALLWGSKSAGTTAVIQLLLSRLPVLFQLYKTTSFSRAARSVKVNQQTYFTTLATLRQTHITN